MLLKRTFFKKKKSRGHHQLFLSCPLSFLCSKFCFYFVCFGVVKFLFSNYIIDYFFIVLFTTMASDFRDVLRNGDWKREKILGSGGFGVITLWSNVNTNERIALKSFKSVISFTNSDNNQGILFLFTFFFSL